MASISSPGIGSGLDVNTIVSQMMAVEKRPLQLLQTSASSIDTKISSYGQIKSALSALYDAANGLMGSSTWQSKQFSTSEKDVLSGSAATAAGAGNFSVQVTALASSQSLASGSFTSGAVMGAAGQLSLRTGRWDAVGTGFTGAGAAVEISIEATDTLADVAGKINGANAGVSAVVVKGANGDQLLVRGAKTGQENGFSLSVLEGGAPPPTRQRLEQTGLRPSLCFSRAGRHVTHGDSKECRLHRQWHRCHIGHQYGDRRGTRRHPESAQNLHHTRGSNGKCRQEGRARQG